MAKYLKNLSLGVICLGDHNLIPGEDAVKVADSEAAHPTIVALVAAGKLALSEDKTEAPPPSADFGPPVVDPLAAIGKNVAKLKAYAAKANIELGEAKTADEIIAAIKAAEAKADAGE